MQRKRLLVWGTALLVLTMSFTACLKTAELEVSPYDAMAMDPVVINYYQTGEATLLAADQTCLVGGILVERTPQGPAYQVDLPGRIRSWRRNQIRQIAHP